MCISAASQIHDLEPKKAAAGTYFVMIQHRPLGLFALPVLAFTASCVLDTRPLANQEPLAEGPEKGAAQPAEMLPAQATTGSVALDAAIIAPADDASIDAGVALVASSPSSLTAVPRDAGAVPPSASGTHDTGTVSGKF